MSGRGYYEAVQVQTYMKQGRSLADALRWVKGGIRDGSGGTTTEILSALEQLTVDKKNKEV